MRQSTARIFQPVSCADPACGGLARPGCIYCGECDGPRVRPVPQDDGDLDVQYATLRERLADGGRLLRRIERYGTASCVRCGRHSLPGRQYCSPGCRTGEAIVFDIDGVSMTLIGHARRRGIHPGTVYRRLQLGLSPLEAITRPIDSEMSKRGRQKDRGSRATG